MQLFTGDAARDALHVALGELLAGGLDRLPEQPTDHRRGRDVRLGGPAAQLSVELAVDAQVQGDVDRCRSLRDLGQGGLCFLSTLGADSVVSANRASWTQ